MKSKNIPVDIKSKSIKEAQNEIKDIIANLEDTDANLQESVDKYNRMMHLNYHIQEEFKKKMNKIRATTFNSAKNSLSKKIIFII